jgi:Pyruvate/2-oxoacid:ferredoxin oxidoreductase delta subunit
VCPKKAIELKEKVVNGQKRITAFVIEKKCQGCGVCAGACRNASIQLDGSEDATLVEEVYQAWLQTN